MKTSALEKRRMEQACGTGFNVRLWCNTDPCGLICAALSWFLVLYAECVVVVRCGLRDYFSCVTAKASAHDAYECSFS